MTMTLAELIGWLTELQKVCGDNTDTNVEAVRLKGITTLHYDSRYGFAYERKGERVRGLSIWLDSYPDGPQPQTPIPPDQLMPTT